MLIINQSLLHSKPHSESATLRKMFYSIQFLFLRLSYNYVCSTSFPTLYCQIFRTK